MKELEGKTNSLFEECFANVDPAVRKEVWDNVDKLLKEELDEAAKEYENKHTITAHGLPGCPNEIIYDVEIMEAFKAGAEWMVEQYNVLDE